MKIKNDFKIVNVGDDYILVPLGAEMDKFNGTVILNDVSAFLIDKLKSDRTEEELIELMLEEYETDRTTAQADINAAIERMKEMGIMDE
ncbi:MAG: PqqD family peptide modification chaperone [Clostridia bacterium]|nr:PqqD family peptide modification chaperone [Clostridia bacterium]